MEALTPLGPQANDRPGQVQIELLQIAPVPVDLQIDTRMEVQAPLRLPMDSGLAGR